MTVLLSASSKKAGITSAHHWSNGQWRMTKNHDVVKIHNEGFKSWLVLVVAGQFYSFPTGFSG